MSEISKTNFSSLPWEIRDRIYTIALTVTVPWKSCWLNDGVNTVRKITLDVLQVPIDVEARCLYSRHSMLNLKFNTRDEDVLAFVSVIHIWASKSTIAQEAQLAFYACNRFCISSTTLPFLLDPSIPLSLNETPKSLPPSLNVKLTLRYVDVAIRIYESQFAERTVPVQDAHDLTVLLECPNLRKVRVDIICKYHANVIHLMKVAVSTVTKNVHVFRALQARIMTLPGCNSFEKDLRPFLSVVLHQDVTYTKQPWFDLAWMWNLPEQEIQDRVKGGNGSREDRILSLVAEEVNGRGKGNFPRELKDTALRLLIKNTRYEK